MLPFTIQHQSGKSISEQVVYAVKKAVAQGKLKTGDPFPSVRAISKELRINPNTAQKAVTQLTQLGILEAQPGIGTRIRKSRPTASSGQLSDILDPPLEELAIEAKRLGLSLEQMQSRLNKIWINLEK